MQNSQLLLRYLRCLCTTMLPAVMTMEFGVTVPSRALNELFGGIGRAYHSECQSLLLEQKIRTINGITIDSCTERES